MTGKLFSAVVLAAAASAINDFTNKGADLVNEKEQSLTPELVTSWSVAGSSVVVQFKSQFTRNSE